MRQNFQCLLNGLTRKVGMTNLFSEQAYRCLYKANQHILQRSYKEAARCLIIPAKEGIPEALTNMGTLRLKGLGLQQDTPKALYWFRLAAKKGCKTAIYNLSICYRVGYGTEVNVKKSMVLLYTAAKQGLLSAQYQLGRLNHQGELVESSAIKAVHWYKKSADCGYPQAQLALAKIYATALNQSEIDKDLIEAHLYANLAAQNGMQEAASLLLSIEGHMVGRQRELARKLYHRWGRNYSRGYGHSCHAGSFGKKTKEKQSVADIKMARRFAESPEGLKLV